MVRNTVFYIFLLLTISLVGCYGENTGTEPAVQTQPNEPVMVITNVVKPNAKALYDKFMNEVLLKTIAASAKFAKTPHPTSGFLAAEQQNPDSTWTYMLIIPTVVTGDDYSIVEMLKPKYGIQKATEYQSIYNSCLKDPPLTYRLMTSW